MIGAPSGGAKLATPVAPAPSSRTSRWEPPVARPSKRSRGGAGILDPGGNARKRAAAHPWPSPPPSASSCAQIASRSMVRSGQPGTISILPLPAPRARTARGQTNPRAAMRLAREKPVRARPPVQEAIGRVGIQASPLLARALTGQTSPEEPWQPARMSALTVGQDVGEDVPDRRCEAGP